MDLELVKKSSNLFQVCAEPAGKTSFNTFHLDKNVRTKMKVQIPYESKKAYTHRLNQKRIHAKVCQQWKKLETITLANSFRACFQCSCALFDEKENATNLISRYAFSLSILFFLCNVTNSDWYSMVRFFDVAVKWGQYTTSSKTLMMCVYRNMTMV